MLQSLIGDFSVGPYSVDDNLLKSLRKHGGHTDCFHIAQSILCVNIVPYAIVSLCVPYQIGNILFF